MRGKTKEITVRSSAAEYLTFVTASGVGGVEAIYADENVWLSQKMMALLYDVSVAAINQHIKKIYADLELEPSSTIKRCLIVQTEGTRQIEREVSHYNLSRLVSGYLDLAESRAMRNIPMTMKDWSDRLNGLLELEGNVKE